MRNLECSVFAAVDQPLANHVSVTWAELLTVLSDSRETTEKAGPGWSPAQFNPPHRMKENAESIHALVADLDECSGEQLRDLAHLLEPWTYAIHSTFTPGRYRLVMPLARPVPAKDWHEWVWWACMGWLKVDADTSCRDASRFYFLPQHAPGNAPECYEGEGQWLDALALPRNEAPERTRTLPAPEPISEEEHERFLASLSDAEIFDLEQLKELTRKLPSDKRKQLEPLLHMRALAPHGERDNTINRAMKLAAWNWPAMVPERFMDLVRPSIELMNCQPEGVGYWLEKAQDCYTRGLKFRFEEERKRNALAAAADEIFRGTNFAGNFRPSAPRANHPETAVAVDERATDPVAPAVRAPVGDEMLALLEWKVGRNGSRESLLRHGRNLSVLLANAPEFAGLIRWHEFKRNIEITGGPFKGAATSALETNVGNWLEEKYKFSLPKQEIYGQLLAAALAHPYNPLQEELRALKWDGQPRAENFLKVYAQCEGNHSHNARIGKKFLISMVARALNPGCKVDTVLIFQGLQGAKKSTFFETLAGRDYFSDEKVDFESKDAQMLISTKWLLELAELSAMKSTDTEVLKAFISKREDQFRAPYARTIERHPRRCVFVGSTNAQDFLRDETGNRRYWPVAVKKLNLSALREERDQLFAEAVAAYLAGEAWWMEGEEAMIAEEEAALFHVRSPFFDSIATWYMGLPREKRMRETTSTWVAINVLGCTALQANSGVLRDVSSVLREMGCTKRQRLTETGVRQWVWEFPEALTNNANQGIDKPVMHVINGDSKASGGAEK